MKKVLFIDRDGTLVIEPPIDYQLDAYEKLEFYPKVFRNLGFIRSKLDFEFAMVTNQDGLGTSSFPEDTFWPVHNLVMKTLENEGITFDEVFIDRSFPEDNAPTRKPRTGMLGKYIDNPAYDLTGSFVIGDRYTDVELAKNLGCKAIYLQDDKSALVEKGLEDYCALATKDWDQIVEFLFAGERVAEVRRTTKETDIYIKVDLDGSGKCDISTGLGFFDHMLEQIGKHGSLDLTIRVKGDLEVDEHHTIEDTALALGECLLKALGDKRGGKSPAAENSPLPQPQPGRISHGHEPGEKVHESGGFPPGYAHGEPGIPRTENRQPAGSCLLFREHPAPDHTAGRDAQYAL